MKSFKLIYFTTFLIVALVLGCSKSNNGAMIDKQTIQEFDLNRYMGKWYEIARFQHSFERDLVGCTATYSLNGNGTIKVVNEGFKHVLNGKHKIAVGKAKPAESKLPGQLKVSFFLWFYAEYNILAMDSENYSWALVGSSSENYLWILARQPVIEENLYLKIVEIARSRGYDVSKLYRVPQKVN